MTLDFETSIHVQSGLFCSPGETKTIVKRLVSRSNQKKANQTLKCSEFSSRNKETKVQQFGVLFMSLCVTYLL